MSAYGDDPVVAEVTDYVTNVKCKEWEIAAWYAYEKIASQKVAAGVGELPPGPIVLLVTWTRVDYQCRHDRV